MMSTNMKVILTRSENWKKWYKDLQASISSEIWPYINPDGQEQPLLQQPCQPESTDLNNNVILYIQLSIIHQ